MADDPLYQDELEEARTIFADRLEDIELGLDRMDLRVLRQEIHSLKGLAAAYGLSVVAGLAHALEQALTGGDGPDVFQVPVIAYLDRMGEALESPDPADPQLLAALLAAIGGRSNAA